MDLILDPLTVAMEIREQLASEKRRLGFFLGAGTSIAVGIPGIDDLSVKVSQKLQAPYKQQYEEVKKSLNAKANVEQILDRIRLIRELLGKDEKRAVDGIKGGASARQLDIAICSAIFEIISGEFPKGLEIHSIFAHWLRALYSHRDYPVEIFTTNYDLLLEKAMEQVGLPFFDGFVGSVIPFFVPESVEAEAEMKDESVYPPKGWTRLWKMHGSINWCIYKESGSESGRIARFSNIDLKNCGELVIFPSREKYMQSRKLPFIAFQDRMRRFLSNGESLLIVVGYSFGDEHLNEILFQALRSNPRLAISAFIYGSAENKGVLTLPHRIIEYGKEHKNLSIYGPDKICIGGVITSWGEPGRKRKESEVWPFWDETNRQFKLGDFNHFVKFLETYIGFKIFTVPTAEVTKEIQ